ncbi:MAG: RDD family protein [Bacilli bacterium]|nr:RDD family protein [Bacilli bacterium]
MGVKFSKRFASFIIDMFIISCIMSVISFVFPENKNVEKLNEEMFSISEEYLNGEMNDEEYLNKTAPLSYRIDKYNFLYTAIDVVITILYFVVFQFAKGGQTIGKRLLGIKVVKEYGELQINDMIFRSFIINSVLYSMICLLLLFTLKDINYLYGVSILRFIQSIIIIVSALMVIIRKDKLALHDIITKTKVIEVKE